jgi:hypothetical protein
MATLAFGTYGVVVSKKISCNTALILQHNISLFEACFQAFVE